MGNLQHLRHMEIAMRLARYLQRETTASGQSVTGPLFQFCVSATETDFEDAVSGIYTDHHFNARRQFLMKRWRVLDYLYGDLETRLARHNFERGQHLDDEARRRYAAYLSDRDFIYVDDDGRTYVKDCSKYNEHRLESLLPEKDWHAAQVARHGPDFQPAENYDKVQYQHPPDLGGIEAPPPALAEWLLRALRGTTFERNPVG